MGVKNTILPLLSEVALQANMEVCFKELWLCQGNLTKALNSQSFFHVFNLILSQRF